MREILFRGQWTVNHTWKYGYLFSDFRYNENFYIKNETSDYHVSKNTIGQFTGLTDSNGKKVFEGDILRFKAPECEWVGRIEFGNPNGTYNWGFQLVFISGQEPNTDTLLWFDMEAVGVTAEIIGNRWDNPELMGEVAT